MLRKLKSRKKVNINDHHFNELISYVDRFFVDEIESQVGIGPFFSHSTQVEYGLY